MNTRKKPLEYVDVVDLAAEYARAEGIDPSWVYYPTWATPPCCSPWVWTRVAELKTKAAAVLRGEETAGEPADREEEHRDEVKEEPEVEAEAVREEKCEEEAPVPGRHREKKERSLFRLCIEAMLSETAIPFPLCRDPTGLARDRPPGDRFGKSMAEQSRKHGLLPDSRASPRRHSGVYTPILAKDGRPGRYPGG